MDCVQLIHLFGTLQGRAGGVTYLCSIFMPIEYQIQYICESCVHRFYELYVPSGVCWALNAMKAWIKSLNSSGVPGGVRYTAGE